MDIQHLVDRLEDLIDEGRHIPLTKLTLIDEERALEIIDQMRISVPEEVDKASRILNQKDRLLAQANEEASRIIDLAKEKSDHLIQRDAIVQAAQNRAAAIIDQARQDADAIRGDADAYVQDVLNDLEKHLTKTLTVVRNGINKIEQDKEVVKQPIAEQSIQEAISELPPSTAPAATPAISLTASAPKPVERTPEPRVNEKVEKAADVRVDLTVDAQ
jgi:cell division septum initiation protein DivIVA